MFYKTQATELQKNYIDSLTAIGGLSNLFSDSSVPYLYYRIAEKVFCDSFGANNLARGDIALDASQNYIGIGLKTFLKKNDKTLQKVAEFDKKRELYDKKDDYAIIKHISYLRNERIVFAEKLSKVETSYYHCVVRAENRFYLYEEPMDYIQYDSIQSVKRKGNSIWFDDGLHEYNFNISKSTLFKRFYTENSVEEFEVKIHKNPLEKIHKCFFEDSEVAGGKHGIIDTVYLPMYGKNKKVSEKSGLNQWNASGRIRHPDEIYIPIPSSIHKYSPAFFPPRDVAFNLHLPSGEILSAKVCQDNNKALMSNPNKALGKWLLRDVLGLKEWELLTYNRLQILGVDSIRIDKLDSDNYAINFVELGSFEEYLNIYEN